MPNAPLPDLAIVLYFLRTGHGWDQPRLANEAGIHVSDLNKYERGRKPLSRNRLEHIISFMGLPPETIDATLDRLHANRAAARAPAPREGSFAESRRRIEAVASRLSRLVTDFGRSALLLLTVEGEALPARQKAAQLWLRLKKKSPADRLLFVEKSREFRTWALCELLVAESIRLAANHPRDARDVARLAVRMAELVAEEELFRRRLQGYALAGLCNAERVCNDLPAADATFARAEHLWIEGEPGDPGLLNPALLPWVEAALHRANRRFPNALKAIELALSRDSGEFRGKILLSKARILETLGDPEGSTAALMEAAPLIDADRDPRDAWAVRFNLVADLCHLGRFEEGAQRIGEVRALAMRMGGQLDLTRVVWLEGKVAAGLGQSAAAEADFQQVRQKFSTEELAYDYALVSLELALVLLSAGNNDRVKALADEMFWIFKSQRIHREALAALRLFYEAARRQAATVRLTQSILRFLLRAQHDPELRYEDEGAEAR
jgi:transcriptional regulator with XRE-family HTH domain